MSIVRTCLRVATVQALRDKTWAGTFVIDSNNVPLDKIPPAVNAPYISVYTDDDSTSEVDGFDVLSAPRELDLVIEVRVSGGIENVDGGPIVKIYPTDEGIETALDIIHYQIIKALIHDPYSIWGIIWKGLVHKVHKMRAHRGGEAERGTRWAARGIIFSLDLHADHAPGTPFEDGDPIMACLSAMGDSDESGLVDKAKLLTAELGSVIASDWRQAQAILGLTEDAVRGIGLGPPLPTDEPNTKIENLGLDKAASEIFDNTSISVVVGDNEPKEPPASGIPFPDLTFPDQV